MTTIDLIHAALATVQDPELHRALPELGMVKSVELVGGTAQLEILLTISGCPMKDRLTTDIDKAVLRAYVQRFPNDLYALNLEQWHIFETENPYTFVSMYQFWIQKAEPAET